MKKMVRKFVLEEAMKACRDMAEEAAESGKHCEMESEGYTCSAVRNAEARAIEKCLNDIHRYKSCPCWVGGRSKSWI